ncbi:acyl-CoA dehydrogenase family protein [Streptomyces sp. NPDC001651]|uniref:acyl-CoA dehydrogenase family protein n=1 Tax=unclassified Streptomyces TaxID=2593676 RepID=UPI000748C27C|nr:MULTISPECIES: acyl-CoA dehydrogenase family protein [unclassified Streptomyces]KUL72574.1 acyl-CoA dehydrogenase [Streptomyces sp. NRRL WC-3605]KUL74604.1 acyl-CoA dehydrogenase [Streptomyces sp. NRRL WC-3604]
MSALPASLAATRDQVRHWAGDLRAHALELDGDPDAIRRHLDLPAVRFLAGHLVPPGWDRVSDAAGAGPAHGMPTLERVIVSEELARGDAGMMLASPGASMCGVLLGVLGSQEQRDRVYGTLAERPRWTCFALTEPERGSAIGEMTATLTPVGDGGYVLNGAKRYVGNAARADVGAVFARVEGTERLGVLAVLVDTADPGFRAEPLPTVGLRGAQLTHITLDAVRVPAEQVLGTHLPPTRRGMWSIVAVFNQLRPSVAAIALGIARAAHEYVAGHRRLLRGAERETYEELGRRIDAARLLTYRAARAVDRRPSAGHLASAAKARACEVAEDVTLAALGLLGPGARLDHPLLEKLARDARGVEFMEGTRNIQKLHLFQGLHTGKVGRP